MKKSITIILAIVVVIEIILLIIFGIHWHKFSEATCTTAPTCECGKVKGEALGHSWLDATCTESKTCEVCGITDGEPLGHTYTETINTEATCTTEGIKTLTCECGYTETEAIPMAEHNFKDYVYNEDATYTRNGTQTGTCECGATDTKTKWGSQKSLTYVYFNKTMYVQQDTKGRDLPCTEGKIIKSFKKDEKVEVVGQCVETGWYEIKLEEGFGPGYFVPETDLAMTKAGSSNSKYISDRYGCNVGDKITLDIGVTVVYEGKDIWKDTSSDTKYKVTKDNGDGTMRFEPQNTQPQQQPSGDPNSPYICDRHGYKIGDQTVLYDYLTVTYQGQDQWVDADGDIFTAVKDHGWGIEYSQGIFARPGEQPVSERLGYKPGDSIPCESIGYTWNRIYKGNDIWYDDNDPNDELIASLVNGQLSFTTYTWK